MSELKFNDITDSLADGFDPVLREELFSRLETLKTEDEALKGVQLFVQKHGRDYELMRNTFKSFHELLESKEKQAKKFNLSWVKYAAVLVLVSGIAFYFYYNNNRGIDLTTYEYHNAGLPVLMGSEGNIDFNNGMSAYKMKDYQKAYQEFAKCSKTDTVSFYQGMSAYESGDYVKAISHLNEVSNKSKFYKNGIYVMGLCNIHLDKKEDAIMNFQVIILTQMEHSKQAEELIEKLKE